MKKVNEGSPSELEWLSISCTSNDVWMMFGFIVLTLKLVFSQIICYKPIFWRVNALLGNPCRYIALIQHR